MGGSVITTELRFKHRVLPIGLSDGVAHERAPPVGPLIPVWLKSLS